MNKELEALELLYQDMWSVPNEYQLHRMTTYDKCKEIIEAALKDYEKKTKLAKEYADVNNVAKRLKALEIIKEKQVDVSCLLFDGLETYNENMHPSRVITQEEFDLLKEVLL